MRMLIAAAAVLTVAVVTSPALAGKVHVPAHYATIQEAVDAARDGDTIVIAGGVHTGRVLVKDRRRLRLVGEPETEIQAPGQPYVLAIAGSAGVRVHGIRMTGGDTGVIIEGSKSVRLDGCVVRDVDQNGITVETSKAVRVSACTVRDVGRHAIELQEGSTRCKLIGNDLFHCGQNGIRIHTDRHVVAGNEVSECGNDGIAIWGDRNKVSSNSVSECNDDGIEVWKAERNVFKRNVVSDIAEIGFQVEQGERNKFVRNTVMRCGESGIWIDEERDKLVKNEVSDCPYGIELTKGRNSLVANVIELCTVFDLWEQEGISPPNKYRRNRYTTTNMDPPP
jgi:parallel beta-helix repeat protein